MEGEEEPVPKLRRVLDPEVRDLLNRDDVEGIKRILPYMNPFAAMKVFGNIKPFAEILATDETPEAREFWKRLSGFYKILVRVQSGVSQHDMYRMLFGAGLKYPRHYFMWFTSLYRASMRYAIPVVNNLTRSKNINPMFFRLNHQMNPIDELDHPFAIILKDSHSGNSMERVPSPMPLFGIINFFKMIQDIPTRVSLVQYYRSVLIVCAVFETVLEQDERERTNSQLIPDLYIGVAGELQRMRVLEYIQPNAAIITYDVIRSAILDICSRYPRNEDNVLYLGCNLCQNPSISLKCGQCKEVSYCSEKCGKDDWVTHQKNCK
jgi:hypothetical protein